MSVESWKPWKIQSLHYQTKVTLSIKSSLTLDLFYNYILILLVNRLRKTITILEDENEILRTEANHMRTLVEQVK